MTQSLGRSRPAAPLTLMQQVEKADPPVSWRTIPGEPGKPVVFLHGYGGTPKESMGPYLAEAFSRAGVALDITAPFVEPKRQRGDRVVALAPTTMTFQLAEIQKLADETDGKLTLIGHSFGGIGARIYATLHPEKVEKLVLLMPGERVAEGTAQDYGIKATDPDEARVELAEVITDVEQALREARGARDRDKVDELSEQLNWLTMCADILRYSKTAPIKDLKVPTLLFRAGADENLSADQVLSVAREAKNAQVKTVEVPGASHSLEGKTERQSRANLDLVAKAISSFLGVDAAAPRDEYAGGGKAAKPAPAAARVPQAADDELFKA